MGDRLTLAKVFLISESAYTPFWPVTYPIR